LERQGLVRGEHGRGTFVAMPTTRVDTGEVDLSLNLPPPILPDQTYAQGVAELVRRGGLPDPSRYPPCGGWPEHRVAAAAWLARGRFVVPPEDLILTNGAQQAISVAVTSLLAKGGVMLSEQATYPGALVSARSLGIPVVGVASDAEGLLPDAIEAHCRDVDAKVIYVVPSLHNPTGTTMGMERRMALAEVARRYDLQIIEDDVYWALLDDPPPPIRTMAPERTWYLNSFSKSVSAVLRLGFLVPPRDRVDQATATLQGQSWTANPFSGTLLYQWLSDGTADEALQAMRQEAAARITLARGLLPEYISPTHRALHLWIPMAETQAERVVRRALERDVRLTPPTAPLVIPGQGCGVRICLGGPRTRQELEQGLRRMRTVLDSDLEAVF
ncbi:MAG: PLP-dependent aminotransferase family protein, partial [Rhodospirillaceae bacterium]